MFDSLNKGFFEFSGLSPGAVELPPEASFYLSRVAARIGYGPAAVSPAMLDKIQTIIQSGMDAVRLAGIGRITAVDSWDSERIVTDGITIASAHWARVVSRMIHPRQVVCLVLTLGEGLDRLKARTGLFETYVLDGFGSEMIEQTADIVERHIIRWAGSRGQTCSRRFSPGYCDWPLAPGQKEIFAFLKPAAIGVQALSSGAMLPSKSISAVMIAADQVPLAYPCPFCRKTDCDHRRG